jgi:hypothetical protein
MSFEISRFFIEGYSSRAEMSLGADVARVGGERRVGRCDAGKGGDLFFVADQSGGGYGIEHSQQIGLLTEESRVRVVDFGARRGEFTRTAQEKCTRDHFGNFAQLA